MTCGSVYISGPCGWNKPESNSGLLNAPQHKITTNPIQHRLVLLQHVHNTTYKINNVKYATNEPLKITNEFTKSAWKNNRYEQSLHSRRSDKRINLWTLQNGIKSYTISFFLHIFLNISREKMNVFSTYLKLVHA